MSWIILHDSYTTPSLTATRCRNNVYGDVWYPAAVARGPAPRRRPMLSVLGRGNNGAVLSESPERVYKWTVDPVETYTWLAAQGLRNRGKALLGLPKVFDIHLGQRETLVLREDVATPLPTAPADVEGIEWAWQRASRTLTVGRLLHDVAAQHAGIGLRDGHWWPQTRQIDATLSELAPTGAVVPDVRSANIGMTDAGRLVLHDPGRAPLETALIAPGEAWRTCPNEPALRTAVRRLLGAPSYKTCRMTRSDELRTVMRQHGWRDVEIDGTAGFHTEDGQILLRAGEAWPLLHELVHAAGVTDAGVAVWLAEGLTEAVAQDIAAANGWKHHATYPQEVETVRRHLVGATGLSVLDLAKLAAQAKRHFGWVLAQRLAERTQGDPARWYTTIAPGAQDSGFFRAAVQADAVWPRTATVRRRRPR